MTDPRDEALQRACPVVAAPLFGVLPAMENGQRVIVASNGVFVQVKRDWLDCVEPLAAIDATMPLPYGRMTPSVRFTFGTIPVALLDAFIAAGRAGLPNEIAGGLIYSAQGQTLRLATYEPLHSTAHRIEYRMPPLARDESIAVDLHTHGVFFARLLVGHRRRGRPFREGCWRVRQSGQGAAKRGVPAGAQRDVQAAGASVASGGGTTG